MEIQGTVTEVPARTYPNRGGGALGEEMKSILAAMEKLNVGETLEVDFAGTYTEPNAAGDSVEERDARRATTRGGQLKKRGYDTTTRGSKLYVTKLQA